MIPEANKHVYHDGKACGGCGLEPEVVAYYHRQNIVCGHQCTCGAIVIDGVVVGASPQ